MIKHKAIIKRYRQIWLTKEGYILLRKEKRKQNKSMTHINDNLIKKNYEKR